MFKGAMGKRLAYFTSAFLRFLSFLGLLIAFVSVKIAVEPDIEWLNALLLILSMTCLATSIFNLGLSGMTATAYQTKKSVQIVCFCVTIVTGGILSSVFTGLAVFAKVDKSEVENENLINIKRSRRKEKENDKKSK